MSKKSFVANIGLDWADKKHDFCLLESGRSKLEYGVFKHTPESIIEWATNLALRFKGQPIAICLELKTGPIVSCLQQFEFITLYFIPPKGFAQYRGSFSQSGAKDDPTDAFFQLECLLKHRDLLREVMLDTEDTRIIQQLNEHRKFFVEERVALVERLRTSLKAYYPLVLELFNDMDTFVFCEFMKRWPNLTKIKRARKTTLVEFFKQHHSANRRLLNQRLKLISAAVALTDDLGIIIPKQLYALSLIKQLEALLATTKDYDKQIAHWFNQHKDKEFFEALPGAGAVFAPRLLGAFGSDRTRYANAGELANYVSISPVTVRSGDSSWVHWRYKCKAFLRQTFVEWAYQTTRFSYWAKTFYDKKRASGKSHQAILRALAFKWIRIIFRCWQDGTKYDEATYLFALEQRHKEIKT